MTNRISAGRADISGLGSEGDDRRDEPVDPRRLVARRAPSNTACISGRTYYLGRYTYHVETANTFAVFLQEEQDVNEFGPLINYYTAAARLGDRLTTQLKPEAAFVGTGPKRKTRLWIEPVAGAEEYLFFRRGTTGGFTRQWTVSPDQLENGFVYFDDVHDDATATVIDGLPLPEGVLPVVDIGDETLATGGTPRSTGPGGSSSSPDGRSRKSSACSPGQRASRKTIRICYIRTRRSGRSPRGSVRSGTATVYGPLPPRRDPGGATRRVRRRQSQRV